MSPAKISSIKISDEDNKIYVSLKPSEVSLAIGKGGTNIKLASMLVGKDIEVFRELDEEEEDVLLQEFADEIEPWVIDALKSIGRDTAKSVLALSVQDIMKRADLDEETVVDAQRILRAEFEENV